MARTLFDRLWDDHVIVDLDAHTDLLQVDRPQKLYEEPRNLFIAAFIGSPAMNLVEATYEGDEVHFGQFVVPLAPQHRPPLPTSPRSCATSDTR